MAVVVTSHVAGNLPGSFKPSPSGNIPKGRLKAGLMQGKESAGKNRMRMANANEGRRPRGSPVIRNAPCY